jgi:hypothetical protein
VLKILAIQRPEPRSYFGPAERGFLDWETLIWRFAAEKSYWVTSMHTVPHAMPVWGIWQDDAFRFSTHPQSRKAKNLRQNPFATVHLGNTEAVLILECSVTALASTQELQHFVDEYNPKYKWDFKVDDVIGGVFSLKPKKAFAWADGEGAGFSDTATRFTFAS